MRDDQRDQGVVQALEVLPSLGFEFPQGEVAGKSEQPHHDHRGGKPGPVRQAKAIGQRAAIGCDEVIEEVGEPVMHLKSVDHVDDAEDDRPCPHITAQIARDGIPPTQQEVGRPDEERENEEPEGEVAGGDGKPTVAEAEEGLAWSLVRTRGLAPAVTRRSGLLRAMIHRPGLVPTVNVRT